MNFINNLKIFLNLHPSTVLEIVDELRSPQIKSSACHEIRGYVIKSQKCNEFTIQSLWHP